MPETAWGERARDWADVMEGPRGWGIPVYEHVLERVPVGEATRLLDVGCGSGRFCRIARDRGAAVAGLDATPELLEIASERTPDGDFRVGDMEELPWDDASFEVVTGFNSFFLASDMTSALREARRVVRPGGSVALSLFGRPERCDSPALFAALGRLAQPAGTAPAKSPPGPALHEEAVITAIIRAAGLDPVEVGYLDYDERYPDVETMVRGMLAAPPGRAARRATSDDAARAALESAARPFVDEAGNVRLREEVRYAVCGR